MRPGLVGRGFAATEGRCRRCRARLRAAAGVLGGRSVFGRGEEAGGDSARRPPSFDGRYAGSTLTFKVNRRDLGGAAHFAFRIGAAATTEADPSYDFAPG